MSPTTPSPTDPALNPLLSRPTPLPLSLEVLDAAALKRPQAAPALTWGLAPTPFGTALLAWMPRGLCHLDFIADEWAHHPTQDPDRQTLLALCDSWPQARWQRDDAEAQRLSQAIFSPDPSPTLTRLLVRGTPFQVQVWQALMQTRPGDVLSYQELAHRIGHPRASRAVGGALAANVIGYLIPCHRIIRLDGRIGHYRWGADRKQALLQWEAAGRASPSARQPLEAQG